MARFDVFANPNGTGYLLDVQTDLLDGLNCQSACNLDPLSASKSDPPGS